MSYVLQGSATRPVYLMKKVMMLIAAIMHSLILKRWRIKVS